MKKLLNKMRTKKLPEEPKGRITNDTLAEHRERVLAGGRKFKYPVQYQRHRLVINTLIIAVVAVIVLTGLGWYLLFSQQNTSEFMYRVTRVVPINVATVDGAPVRYSDYLLKYRSAEHYLVEKEQIDVRSDAGQSQLEYIKYESMQDAVADAYARQQARELDITVSDDELEAFLIEQRQSSDGEVTEASHNAVIEDYYGWSSDEYREVIKSKLLRQKVAYAVDAEAEQISDSVAEQIKSGSTDLEKLAASLNEDEQQVTYMSPTWVPRDNQDGGLALAAAELEEGQISTAIKPTTGDGYYYVKLIEKTDEDLRYEYIQVPLTAFDEELDGIKETDRLRVYIDIENPYENTEEQ